MILGVEADTIGGTVVSFSDIKFLGFSLTWVKITDLLQSPGE